MKILLDTNIIIQRENYSLLPENLANLIKIIEILNYQKYIHLLSLSEIKKDKNEVRRNNNLSKMRTYLVIEDYPNYIDDNDTEYIKNLPETITTNDEIDNQLLYCVYRNIVSCFITEDKALLKKADNLGLSNVYSINEALEIFTSYLPKSNINLTSTFKKVPPYKINIKDPIFDTLKSSYPEFENSWWKKVVESNRTVYLYEDAQTNHINAILIPKIENELIDCEPLIQKDKYIKICLFKVASHAQGLKLGERLLSMAFDYARINNVNKLYLTHFKEENDYLLYLIEQYGFKYKGINARKEEIYTKEITAPANILDTETNPLTLNKEYYPSYYDGINVNKFLVPIIPEFHKMLFPDYRLKSNNFVNQLRLFFVQDNIQSHGNAIKKAYLSHSKISYMQPGDILFFYRTDDYKIITTLGVVTQVYQGINDIDLMKKYTAKRTIFSETTLNQRCQKDNLIILFNQCFHFEKELSYKQLRKIGIVSGPIQSIQRISEDNYKKIIKGNIDERFTIH